MSSTSRFKAPPVTRTADGRLRRVGFELEFSGLSLERTVEAVASALGAEPRNRTAAACEIDAGDLGEFTVELDWDFLKRTAAGYAEGDEPAEWLGRLSEAAALLVPVEVVCPPIPVTRLDALDPLVAALRDAGAVGTEESLVAAYGVHINTEIAALDAPLLFDYLRAFCLLQWWLVDAHEIDLARRLSPYVNLYPETYLAQVLSRPEAGMERIFADYLEHNASRNRALDLLPLLAEIDEARVRAAVADAKVKARPAFHFRLPDCRIERPDWSLVEAWDLWWVVEALADRGDDLDELGAAFGSAARPLIGVSRADWVAFMDRWLQDRGLA